MFHGNKAINLLQLNVLKQAWGVYFHPYGKPQRHLPRPHAKQLCHSFDLVDDCAGTSLMT